MIKKTLLILAAGLLVCGIASAADESVVNTENTAAVANDATATPTVKHVKHAAHKKTVKDKKEETKEVNGTEGTKVEENSATPAADNIVVPSTTENAAK